MGITFGDYVLRKRLERVSHELISDECRKLTICEIAMGCGFNNLSPFNRAFKKRFACTPQEYRLRG
jgi:AraC-like DNA-binding protein